MTKKELIEALAEYPDDIQIVTVSGEFDDYYFPAELREVVLHVVQRPTGTDYEKHGGSPKACYLCREGAEPVKAVLL